jgi:hypothetical protein
MNLAAGVAGVRDGGKAVQEQAELLGHGSRREMRNHREYLPLFIHSCQDYENALVDLDTEAGLLTIDDPKNRGLAERLGG